ncbi:hypothetical protein [Candidatus Nephthysia bennettiae]|uniref:DUF4129 domain-containing protein n=1 Tax=Candidatus Nephthysia bennettiae TaxID=3127016 RepID=A0A934N7X3_9BACT|nr:hypothetical protein [Candidatus Dormibacteraeota bacterium]MBJ7611686.1 hypothetical protein [Candidatus Dormibacteraeota bacterium]
MARQAASELEAGTGNSQPEILDELRASPPMVGEASARLTALSAAARSPAFTPEPRRAGAALREILAQPRYAGLNAGPSWTDRLGYLVLTLLVWLLERGGGGALSTVFWAALGAGAICLVVMLFFLLRAIRRGPRREARQDGNRLEQAARDRFAEADRLAAAGDLTGAVRSLAGAVAAALGDDRDWDRSPLTVREIFARAPEPGALRPLLVVFEAAVYGALPPAADDYDRAVAAAAPFRRRPERAAA